MQRVHDLVGQEHALDEVSRNLRDAARARGAAAVGALHVTCSDESELECREAFQQWFARELLPELKFGSRSPFCTSNLGGRYEERSIPFAEDHFATPATRESFKLLVVKINAHVCVHVHRAQVCYGKMPRYESESTYCGALHALLDGQSSPAIDDLGSLFGADDKNRVAMLNDPGIVDPTVRSLLVAIIAARVQARRAMVDVRNHAPASPTVYWILPCVTLNRAERDTELVVGIYTAEQSGEDLEETYFGLGDDPRRYVVRQAYGRLQVGDDQLDCDRQP
jgi:hypothetical protein